MTQLHAQPYDISANGFYFDDAKSFTDKAKDNRNDCGDPVEEYEIQFIDGERIDCEFAQALGLNQVNFVQFFKLVDEWDGDTKRRFIIANGECGYEFCGDTVEADIQNLDLTIYEVSDLEELAEQFVDEGLLGEIPKTLETYIDFEKIARDLGYDYAMTDIAGQSFAYRCG